MHAFTTLVTFISLQGSLILANTNHLSRRGVPGAAYLCKPSLPSLLQITKTSISPTSKLTKSTLPGPQPDFKGSDDAPCTWIPPDPTRCHTVTFGPDYFHSVGPDKGGYCLIYKDDNCTPTERTPRSIVTYPGMSGSALDPFRSIWCGYLDDQKGISYPEPSALG
jgi:hypothetical protein